MAQSKDPRDVDVEGRSYRRYRQNRLAVRGYMKAVEIVDKYIQGPLYYTRRAQPAADSFRLCDELARMGGLDLITLGETAEEEDRAAERKRRQQRQETERKAGR